MSLDKRRLKKLKDKVAPEKPMSLPIPPEEKALLDAMEEWLSARPHGWGPLKNHPEAYPELVRYCVPVALRKLGLSEGEIERQRPENEETLLAALLELG